MSNKIVIFGASGGAVKVAQTLKSIGLDFEFFVDNDSKKVGNLLEGKVIRNPKDLIENSMQYKVIIASIYHSEIKDQLLQMGFSNENIILKEKYILSYIKTNFCNFVSQQPINAAWERKDNILIDLVDGMSVGGIEKWSITLADALTDQNKKVTIVTTEEDSNVKLDTKVNILRFQLTFDRYIKSVKDLVDEIVANLPCTIIINKINQLYMAAYIVKRLYGSLIKIISVLHSDFERIFEQNELINKNVDSFLCVSNDVRRHFITRYQIDAEKVFFKDSPIHYEEGYIKKYSGIDKPLQIGYGGRLEKAQKRADLLIPLIQKLETFHFPYKLNIAGDGSYYDRISGFVLQKSLMEKVILYGAIPFEKMYTFWKKCDIFINLSDIEGIGLSMLEAMSVGAVPVVTDTAGAKSFIENGINGYVNDLGDVDGIAECIKVLHNDRGKLNILGKISREVIRKKCNMNDYINFFNEIIEG